LENKTFSADIVNDKTCILDVRAITDQDERVNVEVQLKDLHNMEKRTLVHWSREYLQGIEAGDDYSVLPRVITINIVNFDYIKLEEYHTCFHLREDTHQDYILSDVLEIHFINMVKYRKLKIKNWANALERWMTFFDISTPEKELEEVIGMDVAITKAVEKINHVTQDKEFLRQYNLRQMVLSDYTTGINTAMEQGIQQGIQKGLEQVARNLIALNAPISQISQITGLTEQDIKNVL
jgi:predicted transposase/invertase (TIGR01784 family)